MTASRWYYREATKISENEMLNSTQLNSPQKKKTDEVNKQVYEWRVKGTIIYSEPTMRGNEIFADGCTYRNGTGFVHYDHVVILVDDFYQVGLHGCLMPDQIVLDR